MDFAITIDGKVIAKNAKGPEPVVMDFAITIDKKVNVSIAPLRKL
jgi:hypothetical protein